jgi:CBS domain-containing protein
MDNSSSETVFRTSTGSSDALLPGVKLLKGAAVLKVVERGPLLSEMDARAPHLGIHMVRHIAPLLVRNIMTPRPRTVQPKTSVRTLQHLFTSYGFNAFPVVNEADRLLGIATKLDLLRVFRHDPQRLLPEPRVLLAEHVDDIMRRRVVTLTPNETVTTAVDHMLSSRLRSLPVVEDRGAQALLIGIVSRGDVLRALIFESNGSH